ncbi:phosphoesterase PA-phosphatase related [Beutenbergia cavernae DSM 12333]|uniref:Phosphoesterase PA-phosphatase related n=1 Tax=Beutenbergia cavernae (strain ATCC BAA-8 / DSM 12333 / CCUG 43141 / JCM 11478 / NBRC 16432 / NCIMB 13614 / HKI 0122) TaxID=471853 RepID=C5BY24_BEUC1|nr:phosphatase PAP2 family protein [Beutenbergia cavernae]ACQ78918.1 phosphoesterase PA-phosphatase related [Beutenbergia cavernae DSM 12333]
MSVLDPAHPRATHAPSLTRATPSGGAGARWAFAFVGAIVAAVGVWATWRFFVASPTGQRVDEVALRGSELGRSRLVEIAEPVLDVVSVPFLVVVVVAAVVVAAVQRRWGTALRVVVLMVGANLTTQVLKSSILDRPDLGVTPGASNSFPSGHTTVAASVAAAALMVVPRGLRPLVAVVGAAYTAATGVATMILGWHRPSDVIAAIAVVTAWSLLVLIPGAARGSAERGVGGGRTFAVVVLAIAAVAGLAVGIGALFATANATVDLPPLLDDVVGELVDRGQLFLAYAGAAAAVGGAASVSALTQLLGRR